MQTANPFLQKAKSVTANLKYLRLKPFNTDSLNGRNQERQRRATLTSVASISAYGIKMATALISVPLALTYLGKERYGMWVTMSSLIAFMAFADLGIGNGLMNTISDANGNDDHEKAKGAVSSSLALLSIIALILAICFIAVYTFIPWENIFNVSSSLAVREAGPAVFVFFACFLLNLPLGIVKRVQDGYQDGFYNSIWETVGNLLALLGILLVVALKAGLPWLVLAFVGLPLLATSVNGIVLFKHRYRWLRPKLSSVSLKVASQLAKLGGMFFILQLALALSFTADNLVIAQILGAEAVTEYSVPQRLFALITVLLVFILMPIWPAYGEAFARNDIAWIKKTLRKTILLSLFLTIPLAILFVVFGKQILNIWVGGSVNPSLFLLLGFAVWVVVGNVTNAINMFFNGTGYLRFQVITVVIMTIVNVFLSITLTKRIGIPGPIWGTVISYVLFAAIPAFIYMPHLLKRIERNSVQL